MGRGSLLASQLDPGGRSRGQQLSSEACIWVCVTLTDGPLPLWACLLIWDLVWLARPLCMRGQGGRQHPAVRSGMSGEQEERML